MIVQKIEEHTFVAGGLNADSVVLDLGANRGRFSHGIIQQFACRCYAVEPNPQMIEQIQAREGLVVSNCAVACRRGTADLYLSDNCESSTIAINRGSAAKCVLQVSTISLPELLNEFGLTRVDLVKFDVEGAEIEVIDSCPDEFLRNIPQITVEFHDLQGITPIATIERVVDRLRRLGFFPIKMWRTGYGDTLFINRSALGVSYMECLWARHVTRNWWGFKRIVSRLFADARNNAVTRS